MSQIHFAVPTNRVDVGRIVWWFPLKLMDVNRSVTALCCNVFTEWIPCYTLNVVAMF